MRVTCAVIGISTVLREQNEAVNKPKWTPVIRYNKEKGDFYWQFVPKLMS